MIESLSTIPTSISISFFHLKKHRVWLGFLFFVLAIQCGWTQTDEIPNAEREALKALYNATNGKSWARQDYWLTDQPISTWYGVTVEDGHVVALTLNGNNLSGEIPAEISAFTFLRSLEVRNNKIELIQALPLEGGALVSLDCSGNSLKQLPSLPNSLTSLNCRSNQLGQLPELPGLLSLFCSQNQLKELPFLPLSLRTLDCSQNQLTALPDLPRRLTTLNCANNQIDSLPALPYLLNSFLSSSNFLTFEDLIPVVSQLPPNAYQVNPQAEVGEVETKIIYVGDSLTLSANFAGDLSTNQYQWFRNGVAITSSVSSPFYTVHKASLSDAGIYTCQITNSEITPLTGLTINRKSITLKVENRPLITPGVDSTKMRVYPNPVASQDKIWLLNTQSSRLAITLFDAQGRVITTSEAHPANQPFALPPDLPKGIYLIKLDTGNRTQTLRFLKAE